MAKEPEAFEEIGVFDAKTHLSSLVQRVSQEGQHFYITLRGKRVAELKPIGTNKKSLVYGEAANPDYYMASDF